MWADYGNPRKVTTLQGVVHLKIQVRRCRDVTCERYHQPYRAEAEGRLVLPEHEFGLDVIALIGASGMPSIAPSRRSTGNFSGGTS